jgi:uncharacterized membrane protein YfcA
MDLQTIIFVLLSFLFASFIKGITGLGFSTICLPFLTLFIEPRVSIPLVILPSLISNVLVMAQAGNFCRALNRFWPVYLAVIPGLYLGVSLLYSVDGSISRRVLGIILTLYAIWALCARNIVLSRRTERWLAIPVGFSTGIVNGLTGSQIMPTLPFMLSLKLDKDTFIQAINISFTFSSLIMLLLLGRYGLLNFQLLETSIMGTIFVGAGIFSGGKIRKMLPEGKHKLVVLIFLLLIGCSLTIWA